MKRVLILSWLIAVLPVSWTVTVMLYDQESVSQPKPRQSKSSL